MTTRLAATLALGGALAWLIASAGPPGTVMAATTNTSTDTATNAITRTETKTITEPARTDTVTETSTAQPPATTSVTNRTATVQVAPTSTTSDQSSSSGLPGWGWALIGLGAVLIGLLMYMAGRHHSTRPPSGPAGTPPVNFVHVSPPSTDFQSALPGPPPFMQHAVRRLW